MAKQKQSKPVSDPVPVPKPKVKLPPRLPRVTNAQKTAAVMDYFRGVSGAAKKSNREIAEEVGVSEHLVRRVRKEMNIAPLKPGQVPGIPRPRRKKS